MPGTWKTALAALGAVLLLAAAAVAFACAALYLALLRIAEPPLAALGTAGAALVLAAAIAAVMRNRSFLRSRRHDRASDRRRLAAKWGVLLGEEAASFAAAHPRGTVIGCLVAGLAVGADPQLRGMLRDLLNT